MKILPCFGEDQGGGSAFLQSIANECPAEMDSEVRDILAYRKLVAKAVQGADAEAPPATAVVVALHDIVTKSIDRKWFPEDRGKTFCLEEVLRTMPVVDEVASPPALADTNSAWRSFVQGVPGIGTPCNI